MATERWSIDASRSSVRFSVRHMMFAKVRGGFTSWRGSIELDPADFTRSSVTAEFDAATFDSGDATRDREVAGPAVLDAARFPKMTFASTRVVGRRERFELHGELCVRDVKRPLRLEVTASGKQRFTSKVTIRRSDFGLVWSAALETGGVLVGEEVEISLEIEAVRG